MSEWPLVTFTLLVQSSVGVTIFTALYFCWLEKEIGNQRATRTLRPVLLTSAILGCLGLLASTLHMGYPWNAFHALRHISSSWLSREIIFAALYHDYSEKTHNKDIMCFFILYKKFKKL